MNRKKVFYIFMNVLLIAVAFNAACSISNASNKLPRAKVTHLWSYNWYAEEDNSYKVYDEEINDYIYDGDYIPDYEYFDKGNYNDNYGDYVKAIDIKCRKEKGNYKYQFAIKCGSGKWEYFTEKKPYMTVYDFPKNKITQIKVRVFKDVKKGKRKYGKWSTIVKESTHDKEVHANNVYLKNKVVKGYIKGAYKGEKIVVQIGKKKYTAKVKKTSNKYKFKIRIKNGTPGGKIKIRLCSSFGDTLYTYSDTMMYASKIGKGYTKKQVKWTKNWGSPDSTASSSDGWSYWYYDDGSYVAFKNGKVRSWYYVS